MPSTRAGELSVSALGISDWGREVSARLAVPRAASSPRRDSQQTVPCHHGSDARAMGFDGRKRDLKAKGPDGRKGGCHDVIPGSGRQEGGGKGGERGRKGEGGVLAPRRYRASSHCGRLGRSERLPCCLRAVWAAASLATGWICYRGQ